MAYPFVQWPTLAEFLDVAQGRYGAQIKTVQVSGHAEEFIIRDLPEDKYLVALPKLNLSDRLEPELLRSLCRQLHLPADTFGIGWV